MRNMSARRLLRLRVGTLGMMELQAGKEADTLLTAKGVRASKAQ